jgi:hypothetical protein
VDPASIRPIGGFSIAFEKSLNKSIATRGGHPGGPSGPNFNPIRWRVLVALENYLS